jgi:peptidyl-prolyl cis-trans isomerase D
MPDSVKVRHILITTSPKAQGVPGLPDSIAKSRMDSIVTAIKNGVSFDSMVVKYTDDEGSKDKGGVFEATSLQYPNLSKEFAEVAFFGTPGEKKVVKVSNSRYSGYHYIEVLTQKHFEPAFNVVYLSKPILASDETMNAAMGLASQVAAEARSRSQFEEIAKKRNLNKFTAAEIKPLESNVTGLGSSRELVKWMFDAKVGDVSERPFLVGDKYVIPV